MRTDGPGSEYERLTEMAQRRVLHQKIDLYFVDESVKTYLTMEEGCGSNCMKTA